MGTVVSRGESAQLAIQPEHCKHRHNSVSTPGCTTTVVWVQAQHSRLYTHSSVGTAVQVQECGTAAQAHWRWYISTSTAVRLQLYIRISVGTSSIGTTVCVQQYMYTSVGTTVDGKLCEYDCTGTDLQALWYIGTAVRAQSGNYVCTTSYVHQLVRAQSGNCACTAS